MAGVPAKAEIAGLQEPEDEGTGWHVSEACRSFEGK